MDGAAVMWLSILEAAINHDASLARETTLTPMALH
jgi:hypothetical protein